LIIKSTFTKIRAIWRLIRNIFDYYSSHIALLRTHNPKVVGLCLLRHNPSTCRTISLKI